MDKIIDVRISDTVKVEGRGTIFVVKDIDSPVPLRKLRRAKIRVDGIIYQVIGMECWCLPEDVDLDVAGFLVRPQAA